MATTAKFPKIICRVKALYAFSSTEKSSLSFEKGEYIEVLSQLDSGWWDGWCRGNRGWFPSNYVQVVQANPDLVQGMHPDQRSMSKPYTNRHANVSDVDTDVFADNEDEDDSDDDSEEEARTINLIRNINMGQHPTSNLPTTPQQQQPQQRKKNNNRTSQTPYLHKVIQQHQRQQEEEHESSLPEGWTLQIADDGFTKFYFNQHTGGLRWNHPSILDSDDENSSNDEYAASSFPPPPPFSPSSSSIHHNTNRYSTESAATQLDNFDDYSDFGKQRTKRIVPASHLPESPISSAEQHVNLMQFWTKRTTPQGKVYYGNSITHETTWDFDDINPATGRLKRRSSEQSSAEQQEKSLVESKAPKENALLLSNSDDDMPMTWKSIAIEIAQSVQDLNNSVVQGQDSGIFRQKIVVVVDAVRLMLYSSRSMDKDAAHLQDMEVKEPLRIVLSSLAKLILSAKVVNDANIDINSKVQRDAAEVLNAVRRFVLVCQNKNIRIEPVNPKFVVLDSPSGTDDEGSATVANRRKSSTTSTNGPQQSKAKYPLNQDLIVSLQTHAKQIVGSTDALCKASAYIHTLEQQQGSTADRDDLPTNEEQYYILDQRARSNVILLFQNLSSQIGSYLAILNDIDISQVEAAQIQSLPEFRSNKQKLYNSVGLLFSAVQTLTDTHNDLSASITAIEDSVAAVEDAIEGIFSNIVQMVGERKIWLMKNGDVNNNNTSSSSSNDQQGPRSPVQSYFESDSKKNSGLPHRGSINETTSADSNTAVEASSTPLLSRMYNRQNSQPGTQPLDLQQHQPQTLQPQATLALHRPSISTSNAPASTLTRPTDNKALKRQFSFGHGANSQEDKSQFWYLGYDYAESDIEFTQEKSVKGGTLRALVERLTLHDFIDMSFIANFLLTYRSFCTTEEFVELLQERYNLAPPEELTPDELEIWTDKKQKLVRLRVFNVMKNWLENYYNDEDEFILNKLQFFANTVICDSSSFSAEQLNRLIRKRRELDANGGGLKKLIPNAMYGPMPIVPKNMQHIRLLDTDPLELARQLTIMDFKLYSSIRPIECLGKAWSRDGADNAVNVKQSIDYCNRLTSWVTGSILNNKEAKKRVVVIKHWSQVANRCLEMNNYNTCMAILSAFDNSAIGRLKKTWELVSSRTSQSLAHIRKLMGSNRNFIEYREMIHSVNPPCIPFLGIYLQDLTFIEDGNPDLLKKSSNLINFAKQQKAAEVIREIKQFQSPPYIYQLVPEIQDYINFQLETSRDVDFLYERSLEIEPRVVNTDNTV
ncbi:unnamed protein product [Mucor fragilis]